ncbi:MAG: 5-(carboxyamino)imidazole ribonucleotide synthase [Phormidium sp. BM_Day4_Bin.17]|nr:5-(carboxyamino)imidazole ribonucleotide synthase [Phormidium sp. BM_Day4_Bin.17]UCJ12883.1 MAG: 5-(carboxyamino)imidazole ribonucleotide synthase [Phormidium sp. PBR-2020]
MGNDTQTVGIIGGGQLAWMMAQEAKRLHLKTVIQTPSSDDPAVGLADEVVLAKVADVAATQTLAQRCDVITFENEFVDLDELEKINNSRILFRPRLSALKPLLDKYEQRCYMRDLELPVPHFFELTKGNKSSINITFPCVMKARRHGYDGQGTAILRDKQAFEETWQRWGYPSVLIEDFIPFERELAVVAARNRQGEIAIYPIVETQQENQVCRRVIAPAVVSEEVVKDCQAIARSLLTNLDVVGLFGIELFLTPDGQVLVNEIAPRTHNSGHFSLDACETSQFAQILRAVCDLPLGSTAMTSPAAVMVNLLGFETAESDYQEKRDRLSEFPKAHVYWYGKTQSRPGRKLGHVTVLLEDVAEAEAVAGAIEAIWQSKG